MVLGDMRPSRADCRPSIDDCPIGDCPVDDCPIAD
jgi:hypothetical protein